MVPIPFSVVMPILCLIGSSGATSTQSAAITVRVLKATVVREVVTPEGQASKLDLSGIHLCPQGLFLLVEFQAASLSQVTAWGNVTVTKAKDDHGRSLRFLDPDRKDIDDFSRKLMFFGMDDPPLDRLWLTLQFSVPEPSAESLCIDGGVDMVVAGGRRVLVLADVMDHLGSPEWPELAAQGLSCSLSAEAADSIWVRFSGKADRIINATVVYSDGSVYLEPQSYSRGPQRVDCLFWLRKDRPAHLGLRIEVATELNKVTVPIKLSDVPLPDGS